MMLSPVPDGFLKLGEACVTSCPPQYEVSDGMEYVRCRDGICPVGKFVAVQLGWGWIQEDCVEGST